ncbi:MAG: DUF177 domain-containing protein [Rhizobiaceae bacterium]|nr:DUF177 domain-containing protein [Rhizobiaceae bacterium]
MTITVKSPVSFPVHVGRLSKNGLTVTIEADEAQRLALAEAHGVVSVLSFETKLIVAPWKKNGVKVAGRVLAEIEQECVVTLEPMASRISEEFSQVFLPQDSRLAREGFLEGGEIHLDAEGPDSPEPFSGDTIDVGALAEEFFGLAIDPYPRKEDAALNMAEFATDEGGQLREKLIAFTRKT